MLTSSPFWITTPGEFLQAAEAGTRAAQEQQRLGLQTMSLLQSGAESSAARQQRGQEFQSELAQRQADATTKLEALKRGQYESDRDFAQRLKEFGLAEAKQTLEEKKAGMPKYFHDAKGGVYGIDPLTGTLNILQKPTQTVGRTGTISVPFSTDEGKTGRISIPENDPRLAAWRSLKPTVTPGYTKKGWVWDSVVPPVTNAPPSLADYLRTNSPVSSDIAPGYELPDVEELGQPQTATGALRVLSIE